jgi:hypothetical protein
MEAGMHWQRKFFFLMIVTTAPMPVYGQAVTPGSPANSNAASIPNFSGMWAHVSCCGFEPPLSGPGPVVNKSRLHTGPQAGAGDPYQFVGDYSNPILKPQAAQVVKAFGESELSGLPAPTPSNHCWPGGVPFVFWNIGMQMIQQPHQITILYSQDHEVRHVRMNASHPTHVTPSWYGDSVGYYEGDTLVIDTVGIKLGPLAMVDWYGTPHTEALHVVERYRMLDYDTAVEAEKRGERETFRLEVSDAGFSRDPDYKGKGLQLQFTVEDEGVFTGPWSATMTYRRPLSPLGQWPEMVCADNQNGYFYGNKAATPMADKPDF